jgi:hypothetical protein
MNATKNTQRNTPWCPDAGGRRHRTSNASTSAYRALTLSPQQGFYIKSATRSNMLTSTRGVAWRGGAWWPGPAVLQWRESHRHIQQHHSKRLLGTWSIDGPLRGSFEIISYFPLRGDRFTGAKTNHLLIRVDIGDWPRHVTIATHALSERHCHEQGEGRCSCTPSLQLLVCEEKSADGYLDGNAMWR